MKEELITPGAFYLLATGRIVRVVSVHNGIVACDTFEEENKRWLFRSGLHRLEMFTEECDDPLVVT